MSKPENRGPCPYCAQPMDYGDLVPVGMNPPPNSLRDAWSEKLRKDGVVICDDCAAVVELIDLAVEERLDISPCVEWSGRQRFTGETADLGRGSDPTDPKFRPGTRLECEAPQVGEATFHMKLTIPEPSHVRVDEWRADCPPEGMRWTHWVALTGFISDLIDFAFTPSLTLTDREQDALECSLDGEVSRKVNGLGHCGTVEAILSADYSGPCIEPGDARLYCRRVHRSETGGGIFVEMSLRLDLSVTMYANGQFFQNVEFSAVSS